MSQKYNIPFKFYQPFKNSNTLVVDKEKKHRTKDYDNQFKNIIRIFNEDEINLDAKNTLYVVGHNFIKTPTNKQLENANKELQKLISPINKQVKKIKHKPNIVNVALHVRKGGGFDYEVLSKDGLEKINSNKETGFPIDAQERAKYYSHGLPWLYFRLFLKYTDLIYPMKLPPDSFYVEQIKTIAEIYKDKKLNIQIFTDDPNPKNLAEKYSRYLNNKNIKFKYRKSGNKHNKNELEDLLFMAQFDCLIRPSSAFSLNAQRLGNFKVVMSPKSGTWIAHDILKIEPEISIF